MTDHVATAPHGRSPAGHDGHPTFCAGADVPGDRCGTHLGQATLIPATAAGWKPLAGTAAYGTLDVAAAHTPEGVPAVVAAATAPDGTLVELTFRIGEVNKLVAALWLARDAAQQATRAAAEGGTL